MATVIWRWRDPWSIYYVSCPGLFSFKIKKMKNLTKISLFKIIRFLYRISILGKKKKSLHTFFEGLPYENECGQQ